jgi:hypothetical protein
MHHPLPTTKLRGLLLVVGHRVRGSIHWVLGMVVRRRRLLLLRMLLMRAEVLVVSTETLPAAVLYILDMRSEDALLGMGFGLSIVL